MLLISKRALSVPFLFPQKCSACDHLSLSLTHTQTKTFLIKSGLSATCESSHTHSHTQTNTFLIK